MKRLGLDEEQVKVLVRRICESMLEQWANPKEKPGSYGMMWESAALAARTYLPEDKEFYKKMLLTAVVFAGGYQKHPRGLAFGLLPAPSEEPTLQQVMDYLIEVGCTEDEVRTAWVEMLFTRPAEA